MSPRSFPSRARALVFLASLLSFASALPAQSSAPKIDFPAPSPATTIKQRVGLTDIELSYSRPSMRGREIFGGLVPYGEVWRTGANNATKISFSTPVKLNGTAIPAGTYELFTIPNPEEWTVIIHKDTSAWGAYTYDQKNDIARVAAKVVQSPFPIETFAIGLGDLREESATLYFSWERVWVPVKLEVDVVSVVVPQIEAVMASDSKQKPYFPAAVYYLEHDLDLEKAREWFDAAVKAQPDAFYMHYHRARLLAKLGDKPAAIAAAQKSIEVAKKAGGAVTQEYIRLNEALIESLQ